MEIFLAVAGIVISVLMYFAGIQHGKREHAEEAQERSREASEARIAGRTERYRREYAESRQHGWCPACWCHVVERRV